MARILLAEDEPDILHMVALKLRQAGFDVIETGDGFAALEVARQVPPDLALVDIRMPRVDGIEVCRELRAGPRTADIPIIVFTARARPQDRERAYQAGADDYIVKPFSPRALVERVQAALAGVTR
ncbi:response regulator transcription factor [Paractinoplanes rishiriensis]|uniref:Response regulatory domain-containing protein n=1 Tax=Paractinoplanes rishiriensis TaxID=1050105 RepID=A0A919MTY5_9ACTN|nr:response regulator [Actinoplanes rishiriensis]GIE99756.1 hypothetical protein Ari01nite_72210 [Actinoplanes rishiriensis]